MEATKQNPLPAPPQLYRGADTCDWSPEWVDSDPELVALLRACHETDPDELTPQLALADWLGERNDPREAWVRVGCDLWAASRELEPGQAAWDHGQVLSALGPVCASATGWRLAGMWGCLVGWHGPAGWGGQPMGRTWVDVRVREVNRCVWWLALGFLPEHQVYVAVNLAYAAGHLADAAVNLASVAVHLASAAERQADAAVYLADAAVYQAYAAGNLATAAGNQAYAAGNLAYVAVHLASAAERQADAAVYLADAAERQAQNRMWRWARRAWELCATKLSALERACPACPV